MLGGGLLLSLDDRRGTGGNQSGELVLLHTTLRIFLDERLARLRVHRFHEELPELRSIEHGHQRRFGLCIEDETRLREHLLQHLTLHWFCRPENERQDVHHPGVNLDLVPAFILEVRKEELQQLDVQVTSPTDLIRLDQRVQLSEKRRRVHVQLCRARCPGLCFRFWFHILRCILLPVSVGDGLFRFSTGGIADRVLCRSHAIDVFQQRSEVDESRPANGVTLPKTHALHQWLVAKDERIECRPTEPGKRAGFPRMG